MWPFGAKCTEICLGVMLGNSVTGMIIGTTCENHNKK